MSSTDSMDNYYLLKFPRHILSSLLVGWIEDVRDISSLDIALCNHENRVIFFKALAKIDTYLNCTTTKINPEEFIIWLSKRGLYVYTLHICEYRLCSLLQKEFCFEETKNIKCLRELRMKQEALYVMSEPIQTKNLHMNNFCRNVCSKVKRIIVENNKNFKLSPYYWFRLSQHDEYLTYLSIMFDNLEYLAAACIDTLTESWYGVSLNNQDYYGGNQRLSLSPATIAVHDTAHDTLQPIHEHEVNCHQTLSGLLIPTNIKLFKALRILDFNGNRSITDEGLRLLSIGLPNLTALHHRSCYNLTDHGIASICQYLTNLFVLNVAWTHQLTDVGIALIGEKLANLTDLSFPGCRGVTGENVSHLSSRLTRLDISGCVGLTEKGFNNLFHNPLVELLYLDMGGISIHAESAVALPISLEKLMMRGCENITQKGLCRLFANGDKMLHLDELEKSQGNAPLVDEDEPVVVLPPCVKRLLLKRCPYLTSKIISKYLTRIVQHNNLTYLNVTFCSNLVGFDGLLLPYSLTDLDVSSGEKFQLEELIISLSGSEVGSGKGACANNNRNLTNLNCQYIKSSTATILDWNHPRCDHHNLSYSLTSINFSSCFDLSDHQLNRLLSSKINNLKYLNLRYCQKITGVNCPHLPLGITQLDVSQCCSLTDEGLSHMLGSSDLLPFMDLEIMHLTVCHKLTDNSLPVISSKAPNLIILFCTYCLNDVNSVLSKHYKFPKSCLQAAKMLLEGTHYDEKVRRERMHTFPPCLGGLSTTGLLLLEHQYKLSPQRSTNSDFHFRFYDINVY
eukprot:gene6505-8942_t